MNKRKKNENKNEKNKIPLPFSFFHKMSARSGMYVIKLGKNYSFLVYIFLGFS